MYAKLNYPSVATRHGSRTPRWNGIKRNSTISAALLLAVLGFMVVAPLVRLQILAFSDGVTTYQDALGTRNAANTVFTTLRLGLGAMAIAMIAGTTLAWASIRLPNRLSWLTLFPILPIVIPPVAGVLGWTSLLSPNSGMINRWLRDISPFGVFSGLTEGPIDVYTTGWITIIVGLQLTAFVYIFVRSGLTGLDHSLIEAARTFGASYRQVFFGIVLPLIRPSLVYAGGITLLLGLGQFTAPLLLGTRDDIRVLTTEVYRAASSPPVDHALSAAIASPLLVLGIVAVAYQRLALRNVSDRLQMSANKGATRSAKPARGAAVTLFAYSMTAVVLPLGALAVVSLSNFWTGTIAFDRMSLDNYARLLSNPNTVSAIRTSVVVSTTAVIVAIPLGYVFAMAMMNELIPKKIRLLLDMVAGMPLGVPAVVFGAGFLFTYTRPPLVLWGTNWILIIVYVTLMLPYTTRLQIAARMSLGESFISAARVSGAPAWRAHIDVIIPMIRQSIASAALIIFVLLSHEFAASLLVRSPRTQVMGTRFFDLWLNEPFPVVAAMGLIMCAITAIGVGLALKLGGKQSLESLSG